MILSIYLSIVIAGLMAMSWAIVPAQADTICHIGIALIFVCEVVAITAYERLLERIDKIERQMKGDDKQ